MSTETLAHRGLLIVGRITEVGPIRYGSSHEKAGSEVPGLLQMTLDTALAPGHDRQTRVTFSATDELGLPSRVSQQLQEQPHLRGREVVVHVKAKASAAGFVNYQALNVAPLGE